MTALRVQNARTMHTMTRRGRNRASSLRSQDRSRAVSIFPSDGPSWIDPAEICVNTTDQSWMKVCEILNVFFPTNQFD